MRWVALLAILALAFGLRLLRLEDASIWWDEGLAVWAARQSPLAIMRWTAEDVHPPLYFWLLHLWLPLAGDSEFAVRWLSVAFGTLSVAALWRLGRLLAGPSVALLAALFLALSRFAIWWSQEARMYVLGALLATLSLYLTVRLRRAPSWPLALAYVAVTVAALWSLYLLAFLLVIEGLYWLATLLPAGGRTGNHPRPEAGDGKAAPGISRLRLLLLWGGLQLTVLLGFLPWLAYSLPRMRSWSVQVPFDAELFWRLYATLLVVGASVEIDRYRTVTLAVLAVLLVGLLLASRRVPRFADLLLVVLAVLVPPVVVWLVTTTPRAVGYSPKPEARYLLPYAPSFSLLLAWAVGGIARARRGGVSRPPGGVALLVALLLVVQSGGSLREYFSGRYREDDYISIAATIRAYRQPTDGVLLHTDQPWPVFAYHWPGSFRGVTYTQFVTEEGTVAQVAPLWERHEGLWLVLNEDSHRVDPGRIVETFLAERALAQREWRFGARRLVLFARTPDRASTIDELAPGWQPPPPRERLATSELRVVGWEQALHRYRPGELAHLFATVEVDPGCTPESCSSELALQLGREEAPLAAATLTLDPRRSRQRIQFDLIIPPDSPPGPQPWRIVAAGEQATAGRAGLMESRQASPAGPPAISTPQEATFGEPPLLKLLGYDLAATAAPGETIHLTLYWQALEPIPLPYKVFTHVIDQSERMWGQKDDVPVAGTRPTTSWLPEEIIVDSYAIALDPQTPPGSYRIEIGLYDAATGQRLGPVRAADGTLLNGERVLLGQLEVQLEGDAG